MTRVPEAGLATPEDDPSIRRLLRATPMPGQVELTFEREPDYFLGDSVMGERVETPVIRSDGEVVAMMCRAVRRAFVAGEPTRIGYLGQLRVAEGHRRGRLMLRGFRFLRELHRRDPVAGYYATITEGNDEAEGVLTRQRGDAFPDLKRLCTVVTLAMTPTRWAGRAVAGRGGAGISVRPAAPTELEEVAGFLEEHGRRRQLFPALDATDLTSERTRDLRAADLLLARDGAALRGVLGLWNQGRYKQTQVQGYRGGLAVAKPLLDLALIARGARPLPRAGESIRSATASLVCVQNDNPTVFAALLAEALREARRRRLHGLLVGLCSDDPLLPVARRAPHIAYRSALYAVSFDGRDFADSLKGVCHVELATL